LTGGAPRRRTAAIRRTARRRKDHDHVCYAISSRPYRQWIARLDLAEANDPLDLDIAAIAAGHPPTAARRIEARMSDKPETDRTPPP
jgi:hypothetical protein